MNNETQIHPPIHGPTPPMVFKFFHSFWSTRILSLPFMFYSVGFEKTVFLNYI